MKSNKLWFIYALISTVAMGLWGAIIEEQNKAGFPETLGYVVWALTMIPPALIALHLVGWKLEHDKRSILLGCAAGLLGAGGQLVLFKVLLIAPAYLVFPFIALSPLVTIVMALVIARERATSKGWTGIVLALVAGVLLMYQEQPQKGADTGLTWVFLALLVLLAWGIQGFVISHANKCMRAEGIFAYMMLGSVVLIPVALAMTDFNKPIPLKFTYLAALIQALNSVGALLLVYAFRYGKAIIVSPLINAGAPAITTILSLIIYQKKFSEIPTLNIIGMVGAILATLLMILEEETKSANAASAVPPTSSK